ncbi:phenol hydroxylase subunit P4 [Flexivirga oryzae]|uniref:Phenol hydroxylase P4 protein n=1 Tax=Flexivirga oryzae TaxID=1794944 RepID=A0A839N758_9MICO|nr:phenol hydroxylase subunit P4 [Flexivirga oryzae]MBB2891953.1 phenol hydroxylase P4 protein [Flexivirga oryzae]
MGVRSINGEYSFPSRSRAELYGDDQLLHVLWRGNPFVCSAGTFRVPKTISFEEFVTTVLEPWAGADPDFIPGSEQSYQLDLVDFEPDPSLPLQDQGIGHKSLLSFEVSSYAVGDHSA